MTTPGEIDQYLAKSQQSLASGDSDFAGGRYDSCMSRSYYACFQAAIAALLHFGVLEAGSTRSSSHAQVQALFVGQLINRRKQFSNVLSDTLLRLLNLRNVADYEPMPISQTQAARALRRARLFVSEVMSNTKGHT
jgi:uncharacterized protein (UPF0332 family)